MTAGSLWDRPAWLTCSIGCCVVVCCAVVVSWCSCSCVLPSCADHHRAQCDGVVCCACVLALNVMMLWVMLCLCALWCCLTVVLHPAHVLCLCALCGRVCPCAGLGCLCGTPCRLCLLSRVWGVCGRFGVMVWCGVITTARWWAAALCVVVCVGVVSCVRPCSGCSVSTPRAG